MINHHPHGGVRVLHHHLQQKDTKSALCKLLNVSIRPFQVLDPLAFLSLVRQITRLSYAHSMDEECHANSEFLA